MDLKENAEDYVKNHYEELGLSKRFVKFGEICEISNENNLDKDELLNLIDEANDKFIESQKPIVLKEFKSILSSYNKFINKEMRSCIWSKFYTRYYDFYNEMGFDDYIDEKNNKYVNSLKSQVKSKYDSFFKNGFVDKNQQKTLKDMLKRDNFDFNCLNIDKFIDELNNNYIKEKKSIILQEFDSYLNSCSDIISNDEYYNFKLKYIKQYCNFFEKLNLHEMILHINKSFICNELASLFSREEIIDDNTKFSLRSKYNMTFYKFYDEMNLDDIINRHNRKFIPKIIQNVFNSTDGCVSSSKRQELKSIYQSLIDWDRYIDSYNDAFINEIASLDKSSFKYKNVNGRIDVKRTRRNVYYIHTYIKEIRWELPESNNKDVRISKLILEYKDGYNEAVDMFTRDLMKSVVYLSNHVISDDIKYLALVSIPPSEMEKNACSPMRKSINHIKMLYDEQRLPEGFDYEKRICDYGNLLFRFKTVPKSRKSRVSIERHMKTIICTKKDFIKENMAFILMDDITTQGNIMYACEEILMDNGVKQENIYKLAIAETEFIYY